MTSLRKSAWEAMLRLNVLDTVIVESDTQKLVEKSVSSHSP